MSKGFETKTLGENMNEETKTQTDTKVSAYIAKLYGWLRWIIINGLGVYVMYLALFEAKGWAINVTIFGAHLALIILLMTTLWVHEDKSRRKQLLKKKVVPLKFDTIFDLIISMIFASQGWFYIATIWFLQIVFESYIYSTDDKTAV